MQLYQIACTHTCRNVTTCSQQQIEKRKRRNLQDGHAILGGGAHEHFFEQKKCYFVYYAGITRKCRILLKHVVLRISYYDMCQDIKHFGTKKVLQWASKRIENDATLPNFMYTEDKWLDKCMPKKPSKMKHIDDWASNNLAMIMPLRVVTVGNRGSGMFNHNDAFSTGVGHFQVPCC